MLELQKNLATRLLYTNPVVLLSVDREAIMTLTWITAMNNHGGFVVSINNRRHTRGHVMEKRRFCLGIPTSDMRSTVLAVGGCSGRDGNKFDALGLETVQVGDGPDVTVKGTVARILADVNAVLADDGYHTILQCTIRRAWVDETYWDGRNFLPKDAAASPYLTFLGSQTFAAVTALPPVAAETDENAPAVD